MGSVGVSTMFAAYVWFIRRNGGGAAAEEEAMSFARDYWQAYMRNAHKGLGQLLVRLAGVRSQRRREGRTTARAIAG